MLKEHSGHLVVSRKRGRGLRSLPFSSFCALAPSESYFGEAFVAGEVDTLGEAVGAAFVTGVLP